MKFTKVDKICYAQRFNNKLLTFLQEPVHAAEHFAELVQ